VIGPAWLTRLRAGRRPHRRAGEVRAVLHQRLRAAADIAVDRGGEVNAAELAELERLDRLAGLLRRHEPDHRWTVLGVASGVLLAGVLLLYGTRVGETQISLSAEVSELGFTLAAPTAVAGPIALGELGVADVAEVHLPPARGAEARVLQAADGEPLVARLRAGDRGRPGTLSLNPTSFPEGTRIWLRVGDRPRAYTLTLAVPGGAEVLATAAGALEVQAQGVPRSVLDLPTPRAIRLVLGPRPVDLSMDVLRPAELRLGTPLPVNRLQLFRIPEQVPAGTRTLPAPSRPVSTIMSGTLYFDEIEGKRVDLRPGQDLVVERVAEAQLLQVGLKPDRIGLGFRGRVARLESGPEPLRWSLMPTRIEWLQAHHLAKLLWAALGVWLLLPPILAQWRARGAR
jgi:hypothetical protein